MCDIKKLCTCDEVAEGQDHWRLEAYIGSWPSWGQKADTRPEHQEEANEIAEGGSGIMGPIPMPRFKTMFEGVSDESRFDRAIAEEERWLNEDHQFDFDYKPFDGDNLVYVIDGREICFRYYPKDVYETNYSGKVKLPRKIEVRKGWRYFEPYHTIKRDHRFARINGSDSSELMRTGGLNPRKIYE